MDHPDIHVDIQTGPWLPDRSSDTGARMYDAPELYVPASERAPRRDWIMVVARIYWVCGVIAMALALYLGLSGLQGANFRSALMPFAITALCWYGFGQLMAWIFRPALHAGSERR